MPENFNPADHFINTLAVPETNLDLRRKEINVSIIIFSGPSNINDPTIKIEFI